MAIIVQKYGGSSVADVDKLRKVAARIAATRAAGNQVCVVVSAMGDTTDELLAMAKKVSQNPPRRELDMLLSVGERISMALLSMALHDLGVEAISFTGSQSGIITNEAHANARIVEVRPYRVQDELARGRVVIVAGYQGVSYKKEVTTLGRGGSDTTAVALAAALDAEVCEICSDVDGVFSADPRVVPAAVKLADLSYEEMQALAESGAKVLNAQAVEFARAKGIALYARSTFGPGEGTVVRHASQRPAGVAAAIASETELALVRAELSATEAMALAALLEDHAAFALRSWAGESAAEFLVPLENVHGFDALKAALTAAFGARVSVREGLGTVTAVGVGLGASYGPLRRAFAALETAGISPVGFATTPRQIRFMVAREEVAAGTRALHAALVEQA